MVHYLSSHCNHELLSLCGTESSTGKSLLPSEQLANQMARLLDLQKRSDKLKEKANLLLAMQQPGGVVKTPVASFVSPEFSQVCSLTGYYIHGLYFVLFYKYYCSGTCIQHDCYSRECNSLNWKHLMHHINLAFLPFSLPLAPQVLHGITSPMLVGRLLVPTAAGAKAAQKCPIVMTGYEWNRFQAQLVK